MNRDKGLHAQNKDDLDYKTLVALREEKQKYQNERQNPFLISMPHTDKALYRTLYRFDADYELNDYLAPLEVKRKKRPLTKFDILMLNPKRKPLRKKQKPVGEEEEAHAKQDDDDGAAVEEEKQEEEEEINYTDIVNDLFKEKNRLKVSKLQNAIFEDDTVKQHILLLKSGQDAISFFAKYGPKTPIKFLNCVRAKSAQFRPYDLVIIHDYQEIQKLNEYFTVSPSGIVHVYTKGPKRFLKSS